MKQPQILEQFVVSKIGDIESCEDHIHIDNNFIAVFDGVTSKAENIPSGLKPGGILAKEISKGLCRLEPGASCSKALAFLSDVAKMYLRKNADMRIFNPAAAAIIYSVKRQELWPVGLIIVLTVIGPFKQQQ